MGADDAIEKLASVINAGISADLHVKELDKRIRELEEQLAYIRAKPMGELERRILRIEASLEQVVAEDPIPNKIKNFIMANIKENVKQCESAKHAHEEIEKLQDRFNTRRKQENELLRNVGRAVASLSAEIAGDCCCRKCEVEGE